ncbi:MAG TPA: DUF167 domain-containing protein [Thermomicrobiaceae bacterium]|nr:DUF167 domain-containing protein [Thermomicrobiaceae bacterium]
MIALRETPEGTTFDVRVVPRAGKTGIERVEDGALRVRLAAAPVEGAANRALVEYLADVLDCPRRDVEIVSGAHARRKVVRVRGLPSTVFEARISAALPAAVKH